VVDVVEGEGVGGAGAGLAGHVRAFAEMMRDLRGDRLGLWMDDVQADDLPDLHSSWPPYAVIRMLSLPASR
jgi:hypothetical protein